VQRHSNHSQSSSSSSSSSSPHRLNLLSLSRCKQRRFVEKNKYVCVTRGGRRCFGVPKQTSAFPRRSWRRSETEERPEREPGHTLGQDALRRTPDGDQMSPPRRRIRSRVPGDSLSLSKDSEHNGVHTNKTGVPGNWFLLQLVVVLNCDGLR